MAEVNARAIIDVDASYVAQMYIHQLFDEPSPEGRFTIISIPVTDYSLEDFSFVSITTQTPNGWLKLHIPRQHVLLIEESERFSKEPPKMGFVKKGELKTTV